MRKNLADNVFPTGCLWDRICGDKTYNVSLKTPTSLQDDIYVTLGYFPEKTPMLNWFFSIRNIFIFLTEHWNIFDGEQNFFSWVQTNSSQNSIKKNELSGETGNWTRISDNGPSHWAVESNKNAKLIGLAETQNQDCWLPNHGDNSLCDMDDIRHKYFKSLADCGSRVRKYKGVIWTDGFFSCNIAMTETNNL